LKNKGFLPLQNPPLRVYSSSQFRPLKTILKQRLRGLEESCGGVVAGVAGGGGGGG